MNFKRIVLTANKVHNCPLHFEPGDQMVFDLPAVSKDSTKICAHVAQSFLPSLVALAKQEKSSPGILLTCPSENQVSWDIQLRGEVPNYPSESERKESIVERDLRRIPFFASLPDYKMSKVIEQLVPHRCGPEQVLTKQNEEYQALFLIANGVVDVLQKNKEGKEIILTKLTRHDYFGEMSLIDREISSVTIRPSTPVTLIVLPKKSFEKILREDRALERHFEQYKAENISSNPKKKGF